MLTLKEIDDSSISVLNTLMKNFTEKQDQLLMQVLQQALQREITEKDIAECTLVSSIHYEYITFFYKNILLGNLIRKMDYNSLNNSYSYKIEFNPANDRL